LQITQRSVVLLLHSLPKHVWPFSGVGARSATAALLSIFSLSCGVPPLVLRSLSVWTFCDVCWDCKCACK